MAIGRDAVFIHIPKTAGTSVTEMLGCPKLKDCSILRAWDQRGVVTFSHMCYRQLVEAGYIDPEFNRSAFKFCFVRNPFDRALSLFSHVKHVTCKVPRDVTFLQFWREIERDGVPEIGRYNTKRLSQANPQVRWIEGVRMDFVEQVERMDAVMPALMRQLGLPPVESLLRLNESRKSHKPQWCRESAEIVRGVYIEDFEAFGYSEKLLI